MRRRPALPLTRAPSARTPSHSRRMPATAATYLRKQDACMPARMLLKNLLFVSTMPFSRREAHAMPRTPREPGRGGSFSAAACRRII